MLFGRRWFLGGLVATAVVLSVPAAANPGNASDVALRIGLDAAHRVVAAAPDSGEHPEVVSWLEQDARGFLAQRGAPAMVSGGATVRVRVLSATSGQPIAGALGFVLAAVGSEPYLPISTVRADVRGDLALELPRQGAARIWAPGHEVFEVPASELRTPVVLQPGGEALVTLTRDGRRQAGVALEYRLAAGRGEEVPWLSAASDGEGRFRVPGAGARRPLELRITDSRFAFQAIAAGPGEQTVEIEAGLEVAGRVQDPVGTKLPGVTVSALIPVPGQASRLWRRSAASDEAGTYRLGGLPAQRVLLLWEAKGYRSARRWVRLDAPAQRAQKPVVLEPGIARTLRVRGEDGEPTAATVVDPASQQRWSTDARGEARVDGLAADRETQLDVEADGFLPAAVVVSPRGPEQLDVHLRRGRGVRFELRDLLGGQPVTHLRSEIRHGRSIVFEEHRASDGAYLLTGFVPGPVRLSLQPPGYRPLDIDLPPGDGVEDLGVVLVDPGTVVEGTLLDPTGIPLVGAEVSAAPVHRWGSQAAEYLHGRHAAATGESGHFRLTGLDGGEACLQVQHPRLPGAVLQVEALEPGEQRQLGPTLLPLPGAVAGRVLNDEDRAVAGVTVELRLGPLHSPCRRLVTRSDEAGRFLLEGAGPGRWSLVALREEAIETVEEVSVESGEQLGGVVLRLVDRIVLGHVRVGDGEPAAGHLEIVPEASAGVFSPPALMIRSVGLGAPEQGRFVTAVRRTVGAPVGEDGALSGRGRLDGGPAVLEYRRRASGDVYRQPVEVPQGRGPVDLHLAFEGVALQGWVLGEDGSPAAGVLVELGTGEFATRTTRSRADGGFVVRHVPPGTWSLTAQGAELRGERVVTVGSEDVDGIEVELARERPAEIRLAILTEEGRPVYGAQAYLTNQVLHRFQRSGADGEVAFTALRPGEYRLAVRSPAGGLQAVPPLRAEAGRTVRRSVELEAANRVLVRLPEEWTGAELALATDDGLVLAPLLGMTGRRLLVESGGELALPPLASGRWQLVVPGRPGGAGAISFEAGDEAVIDLR